MKFIAIDIQGYIFKTGFVVKELAIYDGKELSSNVFKAKKPYHSLTEQEKKQVKYCAENFHGIHYNFGDTDHSDISFIINSYLRDVDMVFVKGTCKEKYINKMLSESMYSSPVIVNIKNNNGLAKNLKLEKTNSDCPYHNLDEYLCSVKNVKDIYNYVKNCLPK